MLRNTKNVDTRVNTSIAWTNKDILCSMICGIINSIRAWAFGQDLLLGRKQWEESWKKDTKIAYYISLSLENKEYTWTL